MAFVDDLGWLDLVFCRIHFLFLFLFQGCVLLYMVGHLFYYG
uniref:Uncharacterized protein n=1 Tax=Anguilla anguilla TaxID=7936 RepID=A0A0E9W8I9_ANGAN